MSTSLQMPKKVFLDKTNNFVGSFIFEPLEKGYGITVGNTLRRILLSSLEGYAIIAMKIPSIKHEFSTIDGVIEDVVDLILNLKQVRFKKIADTTENKICISVKRKSVFTAGEIEKYTPSFEVLNPDHVICNLDTSASFDLEILVGKGRGYVPSEDHNIKEYQDLGYLAIDSVFSPIKTVNFKVENTRVEQATDYEKLILDIATDGSITPEDALTVTAKIAVEHFSLISGDVNLEPYTGRVDDVIDEESLRINKLLKTPINEDLGLSVRAINCLKLANVNSLNDLVRLKVSDMMKFRNFGKKSRDELEALLTSKGLKFGMTNTLANTKSTEVK